MNALVRLAVCGLLTLAIGMNGYGQDAPPDYQAVLSSLQKKGDGQTTP
jgi:hypothetical protein